MASQGVTLYQSAKLDPRSEDPVNVTEQLTTPGGRGCHIKRTENKQLEEGNGRKLLQGSQEPGRYRELGGQMHEKQHQRGFLFRSQLEGEEDPGGSSMEQSWGPGDESLEAGPEERVQPRTSDEHDSTPSGGGGDEGGRHGPRCWVEQPHSSHHRATGKYTATRPVGSFQPGWEGTVSQRRSISARVVEGTEVLISTVAFFGKVSADGAVGFVFHNLGSILGWAGILDKRPAFEPSRISLLFVKASPGGTPMAWSRKRRLSIDPPPTTTIWARPGA